MTEFTIGSVAVAALLGLVVTCFLWMWGGRSKEEGGLGKWLRRILASLTMAGTVNGSAVAMGNWDPRLLLVLPALVVGSSMGYGGSSPEEKILRRALFVVGMSIAGAVCAWTYGGLAWGVLVLHVGVAAWTIWLGVKNPLHAAAEEVFVCLLLNAGLAAYPFMA